jgi:hypothetical protein
MQLLHSPRPLVYIPEDFTIRLDQNIPNDGTVSIRECGSSADVDNKTFSFVLLLDKKGGGKGDSDGDSEGKEIMLRLNSVDKLLKWMNVVSFAASLEYDLSSGMWKKGTRTSATKVTPKIIMKSASMPYESKQGNARQQVSLIIISLFNASLLSLKVQMFRTG